MHYRLESSAWVWLRICPSPRPRRADPAEARSARGSVVPPRPASDYGSAVRCGPRQRRLRRRCAIEQSSTLTHTTPDRGGWLSGRCGGLPAALDK